MGVRICTLNNMPRFAHGGLEVGERWQTITELTEKQRAALRDYAGRFIRVHPEDVGELAALGLEAEMAKEEDSNGKPTGRLLFTGRLRDAAEASKKTPSKNEGAKPDAKKER